MFSPHPASLTSPALPDFPLVCVLVGIYMVKYISLQLHFQVLAIQLISRNAAMLILAVVTLSLTNRLTTLYSISTRSLFLPVPSHNTPFEEGKFECYSWSQLPTVLIAERALSNTNQNRKGLNCWAPLYFMLPLNISILFITICGFVFCNHKKDKFGGDMRAVLLRVLITAGTICVEHTAACLIRIPNIPMEGL